MKRRILSLLFAFVLCLALAVTVCATSDEPLVIDEAELLTYSQAEELEATLQEISGKYDAQIVVITVTSLDGIDIDDFVEAVYDEMEFGYGTDRDGVLLLVSMDPRQYRILSNGFASDAIGSSEIKDIGDAFKSDLSAGNYAEAFHTFAEECGEYLDSHLNGDPFDVTTNVLIALGIGLVVGLISVLVMKGKLKSVRSQNQANVYVKPGSMQLSISNDLFLYRTVNRRKKESKSSGSSGSSRSVGGGSF